MTCIPRLLLASAFAGVTREQAMTDYTSIYIVFFVCVIAIGVLVILKFVWMANDIKRLADKLAPIEKQKPAVPKEVAEWQQKHLLPEFRDDGATKRSKVP